MKLSRLPFFVWLATTVLFVASVGCSVFALPAKVAIHFDASGEADGWLSRSTHTFGFLALGLGLSAFLLGIAYLIRFFPASTLNVPRQAYWRAPENYPRACAFFFTHTFWLAALNHLFMSALNLGIVVANSSAAPASLISSLALATGLFATGILVWCVFLFRFFLKAPRTAG